MIEISSSPFFPMKSFSAAKVFLRKSSEVTILALNWFTFNNINYIMIAEDFFGTNSRRLEFAKLESGLQILYPLNLLIKNCEILIAHACLLRRCQLNGSV